MINNVLAALGCALLVAACGGGGGSGSVTTAGASNVRYGQAMTITFSGHGLDQGVEVRVDGPCGSLTRLSSSSANNLQFSCIPTAVGRLTARAVATHDEVTIASLALDVPLPQVSLTVTDGSRSGSFVLELDPRVAPNSVDHVLGNLAAGFYTSTLFHRVNPSVGILGGGFTAAADGSISLKAFMRTVAAFESTGLKNLRGTVALVHDAGSAGAGPMFIVNTVDNPAFDAGGGTTSEGFSVFGRVISGIEVVDEIAGVPVRPDLQLGLGDVPRTTVRISAIAQTR